MNEFLENIQELSIGRQDAKKLERSHKEKQYMLDLALEEVRIHVHYHYCYLAILVVRLR